MSLETFKSIETVNAGARLANTPLDRSTVSPLSPVSQPSDDMWHRAVGALRGRYLIAILLGLVCGALAGVIGWKFGRPIYQSEGLIRIAYTMPAVIKETDQNQPIAMYDAFMRSQQLLVSSRRIVDKALQTDVWKATGRGATLQVVSAFASDLKVERPPGTENLRVTFADEDPKITAAAVNAVIQAYESDYKSKDAELQQKRIKLLGELEKEHKQALDDLGKTLSAAKGQGVVDVDELLSTAMLRLSQYQSRLSDVDLGLALAQAKTPVEVSNATKLLTVKQIAMIDPHMRGLVDEEARLEAELTEMQFRLGKEHPSILGLKNAIERSKKAVDQFAADYREYQAQSAKEMNGVQGGPVALFAEPVDSLMAKREVLSTLVDKVKQEVASLGSKREEVERLKAVIQKTREELAQTQARKSALSLELELGDRIEVTSQGEVPLAPLRDTRLRFMAAGGLGGACLPALAIALFGLLRRRYRYSDEAATEMMGQRKLALLGVLPVLPARLNDDECAADAAQCVHQIRIMLQGLESDGPKTYLMSSASSQEGKTSLCVALGMSFAASGTRTLLVDADFVGRGMTRALGGDSLPGLREALESTNLAISEQSGRLSVLTAGSADATDACKVSASGIRQILREARKHFDAILIDSGPILGSVEAAVISREVDGVIFAISRGQEPAAVEQALRYLDRTGAKITGAVFNRARAQDFYKSFQGSSQRSTAPNTRRSRFSFGFDDPTLFGPVVASVASFLPRERES